MHVTGMIEPDNEAKTFNWWVKIVDTESDNREYVRTGNSPDYITGRDTALAEAKAMYFSIQSAKPVREFLLYDDTTDPPTGVLAGKIDT